MENASVARERYGDTPLHEMYPDFIAAFKVGVQRREQVVPVKDLDKGIADEVRALVG
ncbi:MAG TPA: hypothetical protein QGG18_03355 [Rhodospirillales bacterium]|nr:hypothetical protein [Rhodospirillales bacterium]